MKCMYFPDIAEVYLIGLLVNLWLTHDRHRNLYCIKIWGWLRKFWLWIYYCPLIMQIQDHTIPPSNNYTLLSLLVSFFEAQLKIVFQNALQSSCCCIFHLICTTEILLSCQLRFHDPKRRASGIVSPGKYGRHGKSPLSFNANILTTDKENAWHKNSVHCTLT
jgi:hypothetical protein